MGRQHGKGGVDGRGGPLVDDTLVYLTEYLSPDTYKALTNVDPPLFYK